MTRFAPLHRPAVRYFGGKWHLAPWIVSAFPAHHTYVEAFGGGASVLMRKPRSNVEVLNDLDADVVSLYRVLADPVLSKELAFKAWLTPYRKSVFKDLKRLPAPPDDLGRAMRLVIRGAMSMSSSARSGYRISRSRVGRVTTPEDDWINYRHSVPGFHSRMQGVTICSEPAVDIMLRHDAANTLHYADPPYVPATRKAIDHGYAHEMSIDDHVRLLEVLRSLLGYVVLSGYDCPLYDDALEGWTRLDRVSIDNGGNRRVESIWLNPSAAEATMSPAVRQLDLFGVA